MEKVLFAYGYNYAFDTLMRNYTGLEEELASNSLKSMENLMEQLSMQEDFSKSPKNHDVITNYVLYKREQLNYKDIKESPKPVKLPVLEKEEQIEV